MSKMTLEKIEILKLWDDVDVICERDPNPTLAYSKH